MDILNKPTKIELNEI